MTIRGRVLPRVILLLCALAVLCPTSEGSTGANYTVTVNTASLVGHPAGPFSILLAVTDGSGLGDASNTISVTNVDFGGGNGLGNIALFGGASGSLETGVTMTDISPVNFFSESFSPGQSLRFTVSLTTADDFGLPDGVSFFILDSSGLPVPTLSPAADFLFAIDMGSNVAPPQTYGTDPSRSPSTGSPITIETPTVNALDTIPPVTAAILSPKPNAAGWNNAIVIVTLTSTDNEPGGTGVRQIQWSLSGAQTGSNIVPGSTTTVMISTEGSTTLNYFATDNAGNLEVPKTLTIQVDTTPPSISCSSSDGLWHPSDINIICITTDTGSGLSNSSDANFFLSTGVPTGTETAAAATGTHLVCDMAGNCSTAGPVGGNMVDKKPPTVSITTPANTSYLLNRAVTASYGCSDGGSGVASCTGTVNSGSRITTSTVGSKTFTVNATDKVGNAAVPQSVTYSVTYGLCLLYDPSRSVQGGSTIPLKLQLCDASNSDVSNSSVVLHATSLVQIGTNSSGVIQASGKANPDNDFRFDSTLGPTGGYIFNLSTKGLATGSYLLSFTAGSDPVAHTLTFQVR